MSTGCKYCYADRVARWLQKWKNKRYLNGFTYTEHKDKADEPLRWKKPKKIFVNSMSDLFHESATPEFVASIFDTMMKGKWHIYQILTKRPQLMADFVEKWLKFVHLDEVPDHIWLGTSVENQEVCGGRLDILRGIPAAVRFVSFEPLLGPVVPDLAGIHWIIIGRGERPEVSPDAPHMGRGAARLRHRRQGADILQAVGRAQAPGRRAADPGQAL